MATIILNGFGRTLGDGLIGLQALHTVLRLEPGFGKPVLYRLPGLAPIIEELYQHADFAAILDLPWSHATPDAAFRPGVPGDAVIDIREFAYDAAFLRTSMIDFFLRRLGADPATVPAALKRNSWLRPRIAARNLDIPEGYTLVCPSASNPMREMPEEIHTRIIARMVQAGLVVTQGAAPTSPQPSPPPGAEREGPAQESHFCWQKWGPMREGEVGPRRAIYRPRESSLADLCGLVAHARWVISTDTAMVHLADACDVPCLAFFPTHDPAWRVRDYPRCTPVGLAGPDPPGLEFVRSPADLAAARRAWFPLGDDLEWLDRLLDAGPS
jgi:hypothetical protein